MSSAALWLFGLWILVVALQLGFWLWVSLPVRTEPMPKPKEPPKPVSIIVCAKNEAANLRKNLPLLLEQKHPEFEVLVVNDHSTDSTADVVQRLQMRYPNLRLETVPARWKDAPGKKRALQFGLEHALYDLVVLTDADCRPASDEWLRGMGLKLTDKSIVLGYAPFEKRGGWLNRWARYENVLTGMYYLGLAKKGKPYMGVGRNLGYDRKWLMEQGGVVRKEDLAGGDDDLTVGSLSNGDNTAVLINPSTFMFSSAPGTWARYLGQKARHLKTSTQYLLRHQVVLAGVAFIHVLVYAGFIWALFTSLWLWAVGMWVIRYILQIGIFEKCFKSLGTADLLNWVPIEDVSYLLYLVIGTPLLFGKPLSRWK